MSSVGRKTHQNLAESGQSLTEYGMLIGLVVLVLIGSLTLLGGNLSQSFFHMIVRTSSNDSAALVNPPSNQNTPGNPATNPASNTASAASGQPLDLTHYTPISLPQEIQTLGANGTTSILASQIEQIARQLQAEGKLTPDQSNALVALANQGYSIAQIEAQIEQASKTAGSMRDFGNSTVSINGKNVPIYEASQQLGFPGQNAYKQADAALLTASGAGPEMTQFQQLYQTALKAGSLNDPTVKSIIDTLTTQIVMAGDAVEDSTTWGLDGTDDASNVAARNFEMVYGNVAQPASASQITHANSGEICVTGGSATKASQCQ